MGSARRTPTAAASLVACGEPAPTELCGPVPYSAYSRQVPRTWVTLYAVRRIPCCCLLHVSRCVPDTVGPAGCRLPDVPVPRRTRQQRGFGQLARCDTWRPARPSASAEAQYSTRSTNRSAEAPRRLRAALWCVVLIGRCASRCAPQRRPLHSGHIGTGTRPATSAPRPGPPLPHLHRDCLGSSHVYAPSGVLC
jgi:hypothetical protein